MPEFDVDDHQIEAEVCREWLISEAGRQAKVMQQTGYMNVMLHMKAHMMMLQQLQAPTEEAAVEGEETTTEEEPVTEEETEQAAPPMLNNFMETQNVQ